MQLNLPDYETMYQAFERKDSNFEGIFFVGIKSTGIFCRPSCPARKPKRANIEFYPSARDALLNGYRPCKKCRPLEIKGEFPNWLKSLMEEVDNNLDYKWKDQDLRNRGIEPNRVRRWFKEYHSMTFQAYLRTLRISKAFGRIKHGEKVIEAAYSSGYDSLSGFTDSFKKKTGFSPVESRQNQIIKITRILTPLGPMLAGATDKGICLLEFVDRRMLETQLKRIKKIYEAELLPGQSNYFEKLNRQIKEYFEGNRKEFTIPIEFDGTEFQKIVWTALQKIPFGETRTYEQQAHFIGRPEAVRAVAKANGDNRIAIIIPCHRVIGKNGKLVGYGGGLWRKQYLLNLETKQKSA